MRKCDIVIPVWNELEWTRNCIDSLKKNTDYPYRLVVIDNGSEEQTAKYLDSLKGIFADFLLIRNSANFGFVKAVNQGMKASANPYILLLNNDTLVTDNWLTSLIETVESGPDNIGIANPTSNVFGMSLPDGKTGEWQELDSCKGFCMLIKRTLTGIIGYFDEIYGMGYFEEKDFSRRAAERGYISIRAKGSFVFHRDRISFDKLENREQIFRKNEDIFNERWGKAQNIAFVARQKSEFEERKEVIYKLLTKGHRIHLFFSKKKTNANLKDHINIKYLPLSNIFFGYSVLFKLWERRNTKKIELIVLKDKNFIKFFEKFKFIHKAEIKDGNF